MTVIRNNSISGINSITAQSGALNFYDSTGNTLSIGASVSGNITGDVTGNLTGNVTVATGATISGSTNTITASTNGSERVRVDSSGRVGVGLTDPSAIFHVDQPSTLASSLTWGATAGQILRNEDSEFAFGLSNASPFPLWIQGRTNQNVARQIVLNPLGGNIGIGTDNPTATLHVSGGNIKVDSGYGIDFSAASGSSAGSTSALLDDYEEGTWTPALSFGGTACTMNTSGNQKGAYVRIGGIVCCSFNMSTSSRNGGTGSASMSGFPFSTSGISNLPFYNGNIQPDSGMNTLPTGAGSVMIYLGSGTSAARILYMTNDVHSDVQGSQMSDSMTYYGYITYRVG